MCRLLPVTLPQGWPGPRRSPVCPKKRRTRCLKGLAKVFHPGEQARLMTWVRMEISLVALPFLFFSSFSSFTSSYVLMFFGTFFVLSARVCLSIGHAAAFLVSNNWMTGAVLDCDGGAVIR